MDYGDLTVRQATSDDAHLVAPLFDAYRQFYRQPSDIALAERFLRERIERGESIVLVAQHRQKPNEPLGFVQIYPSFSSVRCCHHWILNDLFVAASARRSGVGEALMAAAEDWARRANVTSIALTTAHDNRTAQKLYERTGYVLDEEFRTYNLAVT